MQEMVAPDKRIGTYHAKACQLAHQSVEMAKEAIRLAAKEGELLNKEFEKCQKQGVSFDDHVRAHQSQWGYSTRTAYKYRELANNSKAVEQYLCTADADEIPSQTKALRYIQSETSPPKKPDPTKEFLSKVRKATKMGKEYSALVGEIAEYINANDVEWSGESVVDFQSSVKMVRDTVSGPQLKSKLRLNE